MAKRDRRVLLFILAMLALCITVGVVKRHSVIPAEQVKQIPDPSQDLHVASATSKDVDVTPIAQTRKNPPAVIHEGIFGKFEVWAQKYAAAATPQAKAALEEAGIALAKQRRGELKTTITKDPKHALELALAPELRNAMPKSISNELEQVIDTKASLAEAFPCDCCGRSLPPDSKHVYEVSYGTHVLHANIYGDTKPGFSVQPVPVKGISLDTEMAVADSSSASSGTAKSREGYTGGSLGIGNPNELPGGLTFGKKTYLLIRINFPDDSTEPINEFTAYDVLRQVDQYYNEDSYGKFSILPTVTPLITMPRTKQWYFINDQTQFPTGNPPWWGICKNDALAAAAAAGYDPAQYDFVGLRFNTGSGTSLSGRPMILSNNGPAVWVHELGHDLGYPHANSYVCRTPGAPGNAVEYGNPFDVMGSGGDAGGVGTTIGHNNITFKNLITQWLPDFYISMIAPNSKGTYRIFAMDYGTIDPANKYGLRILKDDYRDMWVEFRQNQFSKDPFLPNGVTVNYSPGFWGNYGGQTAGSGLIQPNDNWGGYLPSQMGNYPPNNVLNIASRVSTQSDVLLVGQTLADDKAGVYITPIAKNATSPTSMDVVVNVGNFSSQPVPTIQPLTAAPAPDIKGNYMANQAVTFTATANDSAGNPLAYFWDFNDGTYSTDNKSSEMHSWSKLGTYRVRCIVSDMMGHRVSAGITVTVTSPSDVVTDFVVTGNCTVLADSAAGVDGVQVSGLGELVYSDSNGAYLTHNISGGTLVGVKEGYRGDMPPPATTASSNDPNWNSFYNNFGAIPSGVSATNKNLTSVHRCSVSFSPATAAVNEGTTLTVTVTRTLNVGSGSTVAEQNAYNWWLATKTPVTVWIPEILGDGTNGDPYGVHSVEDVLSMITIAGTGTTPITNSSLIATAGATAHVQWTFNIPAGATSATAKITFKSLAAKNPPRVLQFILQNSLGGDPGLTTNYNAGYTAADPTSGQMIITVTDPTSPPTATLVANQPAAVEGGASGQFTLNLDKAPAADLPINFQVLVQSPTGGQSGSTTESWGNPSSAATPVADYKLTDASGNPITLTAVNDSFGNIVSYTASTTVKAGNTSTVINVNPVDNGLLDPNKIVDLLLNPDTSAPAKYILGTPQEAVVNIADKSPLPILSIVATVPICTEGQDGKFTVTRTASDVSKPMTVPYSIGGSALNGVEYKRLYGSVIIPAGATSADIIIHSLADTLLDNGNDALQLAPSQIGDVCTLTLKSDTAWSIDFNHYRDNVIIQSSGGKPFVSVQTGNALGTGGGTCDEANKGNPGWFKFSRLNTKGDLVINYTVSGSAVLGQDYQVDVPAHPPKNQATTLGGTITIPDTFTEAYVNLDVFFDDPTLIEDTRTVVVTITPSGTYDIDPSGSSATFLILDGTQITSGPYAGTEVNTITLTSTNRSATEVPVSNGNFYVERSGSGGAESQPLTVNFSLKSGPGYAVQGTDFKLVEHNSGVTLTNTVTIPASAQFASIDVIPIDNAVSEGTLKVTMTITDMTDALNNPYSVGVPNTDTVTISDGDPNGHPTLPTVSFDVASAGSIVRPTNYQIGVSLSSVFSQVVTVDYHISGGTALILADYDLVPNKEIFGGTLTFNPGQTHQTINLDILNTKRLADLTIIMSLSNAFDAVIGSPSVFTYTINDPTPVINSDLAPVDVIGTPFNYQITATNGPLTSYSAVGLPSWATLNTSTGVISGTPTAPAATTQVTITVTNAYATSSATLVITIDNPVPPVVTGGSVTANVGFPYNPLWTISATNFPSSYGASGLPTGLSVNTTTGVISGTPTGAPGTYNVTLSATNLGGTGTATLVITLKLPPPPVINSATSDNATAGWPYSYQITATNFPTSFGATNLPTGLSINSSGLISGSPGAAGVFTINLSATNAGGTGTGTLTLTVTLPAAPAINSAAAVSGVYNVPFTYQITATNIPLSFTASGLPSWATLDTTTGAITGTPDAVGSSTVTLTATNLGGTSAPFTLTVNIVDALPPVITSGLSISGVTGQALTYQITATNNPTSYSATNLPAGLTLDTTTGIISGSPTLPVTTNVTISATNHGGTGSATLVITVTIDPSSGPIITSGPTANPNPANVNDSVTFFVAAADPHQATLFYSWNFGDGTFGGGPATSHTYTADGTYTVTVTAMDSSSKSATATLTMVVGTGGGTGGGPATATLSFTVSKLQGVTKFTSNGHDGVAVIGVLNNVPTPFNPTGQALTLNIGGASASFTLDKRGKAKNSTGSFAFKLKALKKSKSNPNPGFNGGNLTFSAKFAHGSWASLWNLNANTANGSMPMAAVIVFGGNSYTANVTINYSGNSKGGKFKNQ